MLLLSLKSSLPVSLLLLLVASWAKIEVICYSQVGIGLWETWKIDGRRLQGPDCSRIITRHAGILRNPDTFLDHGRTIEIGHYFSNNGFQSAILHRQPIPPKPGPPKSDLANLSLWEPKDPVPNPHEVLISFESVTDDTNDDRWSTLMSRGFSMYQTTEQNALPISVVLGLHVLKSIPSISNLPELGIQVRKAVVLFVAKFSPDKFMKVNAENPRWKRLHALSPREFADSLTAIFDPAHDQQAELTYTDITIFLAIMSWWTRLHIIWYVRQGSWKTWHFDVLRADDTPRFPGEIRCDSQLSRIPNTSITSPRTMEIASVFEDDSTYHALLT